MIEYLENNIASYTDVGPRKSNEDSLFAKKYLNSIFACIADGVGGIKFGELASTLSTERFMKFAEEFPMQTLDEFIISTNQELLNLAREELNVSYIATTFTGVSIKNKVLKGVHIGDSRAVIVRDGKLITLTEEHNLSSSVNLSNPKNNIYYKPKYGKNILTKVLGKNDNIEYQKFAFRLKKGDRLILSTDGFHETIRNSVLIRISSKYRSVRLFVKALERELDNYILKDNVSFLVIEI